MSILLIAASHYSVAQLMDTAQALRTIQSDYALVRNDLGQLKKTSVDVYIEPSYEVYDDGDTAWMEDGSPWEEITLYSDAGGVRLLVVEGGQQEGYSTFYKKEYYLKNGSIFFIYQESGCPDCPDPDSDGELIWLNRVEERRFYFYQGQLIRSLIKQVATKGEVSTASSKIPNSEIPLSQEHYNYKKAISDYQNYLSKVR